MSAAGALERVVGALTVVGLAAYLAYALERIDREAEAEAERHRRR